MPYPTTNALKFDSGSVGSTTLDVYFVDVGQGNCVLVKFPNDTWLLVDAGSTSSSPGASTILKSVNKIVGKNKISTVVITHPDSDHHNLIPSISQAAKPDNVFIGAMTDDYPKPINDWFESVNSNGGTVHHFTKKHYNEPITLFNPGLRCEVYVLAVNVAGDSNTQSVVLSIDYINYTVILTGDATASTEQYIMAHWDDMAIMGTLLSFGHHGSNHSSSKPFLTKVSPSVGTFSASSWHMGYGHPRCVLIDYVEDMVDEGGKNGKTIPMHQIDCWNPKKRNYVIEQNDLGVYLTATQGNIRFTTDGQKYEVWTDKLKP